MAKQTINVGATANDKKGDSLRAAFQKVNANFTELYTALGLNSDGTLNLGAFEFSGSTMSTTDSTPIVIDQSVTVSSDLTVGGDVLPSVANGGNLGSLAKPFNSLYVSNSTVYFGGVPLSLDSNNEIRINNVPLSQTNNVPADVSDLTDSTGLLGGDTGDITFTNSTVSAGNEDEIIIQAKDTNSFATARLSLEPVYSNAQLSAYSAETVETFTLANGDFATGVWQNNGFGNGVVAFTGAQNIGDFFQNILSNLTAANVSITINSEPAILWNGGFSGAGTSTPGFGTNPTVPVSPITITSIVFRYRSQSFVSVNQDNSEIRLKAQNATIRMDADLDIRMFADSQIEIQSGDTLSISAGENISISNGSNDTISISTGDLNITAFDDVNFRASDSFLLRNTSASAPIRIRTDDNNTQQTWSFGADGTLTLPGTGTIRTAFGAMSINAPTGLSNLSIKSSDATTYMIVGNGSAGITVGSYNWQFSNTGNFTFPDSTIQTTAWTGNFGYLTADKDTIRGTSDYQYTFATDGYFTASTSSESPNYFFVTYNATNANIAAGWTVVGGTADTTVSSVTYPVAGYPGVIRVNLTAAASSTSGFYPVTVTSPDRLRVEIQPNPGTSDKFTFATSGLTLPIDGNINLSGGNIVQDTDENLTISVKDADDDGYGVRLVVLENDDNTLTRVEVDRSGVEIVTAQTGVGYSWKFGESGELRFPDATVQTTAYTGPQTSLIGAVDNNVLIRTSETVVTNNLYTNTTDFSTDVDIGGGTIISGWLQRNSEQIEISLFGPADFRTYLTGLSLGRTVIVTYSTAGGNQTLTRPLTQIFANIAQEDPSNPGWTRVAGRIDATLPVDQTGIVSINFPVTTTPQRDWTFSDTGTLTFPNATVQTTAFTGNAATVDITNTNGIDTNYSITFVENRDGAEILRADVDLTFNSATNTLTSGNVEVKQTITGGIIESGSDFIITSQPNPDRNNACNIGIYPGGATGTASEAGFVSITGGSSDVVGLAGGDIYLRGGAHTNGGVGGTIKVESILKIDDSVHEKFQLLEDATGTVVHNCANGNIFYHASPDANWTVNLTNLNLSEGYATTITIIIDQGNTGYYPNALQVAGAAQTINWQGNTTPTPSANRLDVVSFSILAVAGGGYIVFGQLTGF